MCSSVEGGKRNHSSLERSTQGDTNMETQMVVIMFSRPSRIIPLGGLLITVNSICQERKQRERERRQRGVKTCEWPSYLYLGFTRHRNRNGEQSKNPRFNFFHIVHSDDRWSQRLRDRRCQQWPHPVSTKRKRERDRWEEVGAVNEKKEDQETW